MKKQLPQCIYCLNPVPFATFNKNDGACASCVADPPRLYEYRKCGFCGSRDGKHEATCTVNFPKCFVCGEPANLVEQSTYECQAYDRHGGRYFRFKVSY